MEFFGPGQKSHHDPRSVLTLPAASIVYTESAHPIRLMQQERQCGPDKCGNQKWYTSCLHFLSPARRVVPSRIGFAEAFRGVGREGENRMALAPSQRLDSGINAWQLAAATFVGAPQPMPRCRLQTLAPEGASGSGPSRRARAFTGRRA